ncbi:hypothetical protein T492DRAFT_1026893 [Pavlovales sp. CCMP2436]|nr:hypothetical protein T492DRAFT_1026893 [Pavlovales sp. CCMP2436]|mmetsp:Transcript_13364/g.31508  ORF Transcript_13364/g.31508 Transcript_13364/m.31508 type:complete len:327 (+) Transcript_13364:84-1064(+)
MSFTPRESLLADVRRAARARSGEPNDGSSDDEGDNVGGSGDLAVLRSSALVTGAARAAFRAELNRALSHGVRAAVPAARPPPHRHAHHTTPLFPLPLPPPPPPPPPRLPPRDPDEHAYRASGLAADLDLLVENSVVQALLEGAFRRELEGVISRRASEAMGRLERHSRAEGGRRSRTAEPAARPQLLPRAEPARPTPTSSEEIDKLARQIANLERMMTASFELQLSVQRMVQQEVAAALALSRHGGGEQALPEPVLAKADGGSVPTVGSVCILCCDRDVNCAFVGCGHMCYCMHCAHLARARGEEGCPLCRAPVRDLLQVFPDWQR